ncbi:MAG: acetate kinase [Victivallales bacterium]|nr:acetate kinase [Victivallales bacterium]
MKVLVLNAGSSSVKFTLFAMKNETVMAKGLVERIGLDNPQLIYKHSDGREVRETLRIKDHRGAIGSICAKLVDPEVGVLKSLNEVQAIGHRVLHGGMKMTRPTIVDDNVKAIIRECFPLGPLHNPANLAGIEACEKNFPGIANIAVFDTAFHQTMPPEAYLYPLPYEMYEKNGYRKYGFHGTSHNYVANATAKYLERPLTALNLIVCHLGNGCSLTAIRDGKVIDTSMGLTPLEGLMMGTRCGDIDASIVVRMIENGMTPAEVDQVMNKKSGLLGVSGLSSDMRDILKAAEEGNERAALARRMFVLKVVKYIGAYYTLLHGVDAVVFTGGVGEFSIPIRREICEELCGLGIKMDQEKNGGCFGKSGVISTPDSKCKLIVMPTNEELMIARCVVRLTEPQP